MLFKYIYKAAMETEAGKHAWLGYFTELQKESFFPKDE